jgi:hypothetical protein
MRALVAGHPFAGTCEREGSMRPERYQDRDWWHFDVRPGDRAPWDGPAVRRVRLDGWPGLHDPLPGVSAEAVLMWLEGLPSGPGAWTAPFEWHHKPRLAGYENSGPAKLVVEMVRIGGEYVPHYRLAVQAPVIGTGGRMIGVRRVQTARGWQQPVQLYSQDHFRLDLRHGPAGYVRLYWHGQPVDEVLGTPEAPIGYPDGRVYPQLGMYGSPSDKRTRLRLRVDRISAT